MHTIVVLALLCSLICAQHTQNAARCVANSPITAFDGCKAWDSLVTSCGSYASTSDADGYFNCYCQQAYLNALYDCNNEERLCLPQSASQIDAGFIDDYSSWHKWCDPVVLYHPTTPVLSSITVTYDANACPAASTACLQMFYSRSQCQLTGQIDDITAQSSCLCAPAVLSLEYTCSVLGNVSCLQIPAHLESMTGYSYCSNIRQVLTVPQSLTASLGPGTTNRETYYTPPSTTASQAPTNFPSGPSATSPSSANNAPSGAVIHFLLQDAGLTVAIILLWTVLAT